MKTLSLNKIYLGGISLLFILSVIFTALAIFEEYRDFERETIKIKQEFIQKTNKKLQQTAYKIDQILKISPKNYNQILNIILDKSIYVEIKKEDLPIFIHSTPPKKPISYTLIDNSYKIILQDSFTKIEKLIESKKKALIHKLTKTMLNFLTLAFIIYMFALGGFYLLNEFLKEEINIFVKFFQKAYQEHIYIKFSDIKIKEFLNIAVYVNKMLKEINTQNKKLERLNLTLEEKVRQKTRKLQNLITEQENFIKTAIHEINTPLAIILTSLNFLDKKDKNIQRIESAVLMINNIYADLSFVLKYKHKNYPLQIINIKDILKERIQFFETIANAKKLKFEYEIKNFNICINKEELIRIIDNNLSNAIKYSIPGSVIKITAKQNTLIFKNKTNEINNIDKFFDPFYKEHENTSGFGLGLYLVNEICKKYNIKVNVTHKDNIIRFEYHFKECNENSLG
ncbi:sensor histidine kinase [Nautilia lithotrophica]